MTPELNLLSVIYLIGAVQGLFLVVALLDGKISSNRQANRYLAFFLMLFSLALVDEFLFQSHYFYNYPHLIGLIWPLDYLYGPLFYFYICTLTTKKSPLKKRKKSWHFILFFIGIFLALPTWMLDGNQKIMMLYGLNGDMSKTLVRANIFDTLASLFAVIQMAVYIWLSFRHLRNYRQNIRQQFSSIEEINLSWLLMLLWLLISLWVLYIVHLFFSHPLGIGDWADVLLHILLVLFIYGLGYMGLRQPTVFKYVDTPLSNDKYIKSKLSKENSKVIKNRLLTTMNEHKPYLDGDITLSSLSDLVGCTSNNLSQVINSELEKTFFDFINSYRIDQSKQYLHDIESKEMTILAIALESGFNSKSAFYSAFKKEVEMTPSQYKKSIKN